MERVKRGEKPLYQDEETFYENHPDLIKSKEVVSIMDKWKDTDLYKFTSEHQNACVDAWGGYIGKNDGYTPYGFTVEHENKIYYFGLDGHYIKEKSL